MIIIKVLTNHNNVHSYHGPKTKRAEKQHEAAIWTSYNKANNKIHVEQYSNYQQHYSYNNNYTHNSWKEYKKDLLIIATY